MRYPALIALAVATLLALMGSVFVVPEGRAAIVLNLGRVVRTDLGPGLHFKWPLVETQLTFDRRLNVLPAEPERYLTSERKDVSVDFFAVGRIENLRAFYRATGGDEKVGIDRLAPIIKDSLRNEINTRTLSEVVSGDRGDIIAKQLQAINQGAATLGIRIVDLRIKQIDLPTDSKVISDVYSRMRAQRQQVASRLRAEGAEQAQQIKANADRDSSVIVASPPPTSGANAPSPTGPTSSASRPRPPPRPSCGRSPRRPWTSRPRPPRASRASSSTRLMSSPKRSCASLCVASSPRPRRSSARSCATSRSSRSWTRRAAAARSWPATSSAPSITLCATATAASRSPSRPTCA